jgi:hypothetical protein
MVVRSPDTALRFTNELIIDQTGQRWRMTTHPRHSPGARSFHLEAELQRGNEVLRGSITLGNAVIESLEEDLDLRAFAVREIKKYLDRTSVADGFGFELPYLLGARRSAVGARAEGR